MIKFIKMNISSRLILALLMSIGVLMGFGIFAIIKIDNLTQVTKKIYDDPLKVSNAATEMRVDILKIQKEIRNIILANSEEEIIKYKSTIALINNDITEHLNIINQQAVEEEALTVLEEIRIIYSGWRVNHQKVITLALNERKEEAIDRANSINEQYVEELLDILILLDEMSQERAVNLIGGVYQIEKSIRSTIIILMLALGSFLSILFIFIIESILRPINTLINTMNKSINTGNLNLVHLGGDNEIVDIAKYYNILVEKLNNQFWIKDSQNQLNHEIIGDMPLNELTQKALNYLVKTAEAEDGAFYLFNDDKKSLYLLSSYASKRECPSDEYKIGEGIVGQVALERKPMLFKKINKKDENITYTFPLLFEDKLYGVIELVSFNEYDGLKKEFLSQASKLIPISLNSALQSEKVKKLLEISKEAQREVNVAAYELKIANEILEEQQQQLQQQTAELQQTNAELEQQKQLLQYQREELQQTNTQLEEQQQILEEQTSLLNMKNFELESSKDELLRYSQQLEQGNKYKTEFLANMSHELRTPLNSIILLSRLLINNKDRLFKNDIEKVEVINNSGKELLRLINDILDLSKIEAGKVELNNIEFSSGDLAKELKQLFQQVAEAKNIQFTVEDSINTRLFGDKNKISQILRNLISNAIKFTEEGLVTFRISTDVGADNIVVFTVTDTGIGIPKKNIKNIFDEFQQGDGSISRRFGGTGLGLSISKKLAVLMGGRILVESLSKGSQFTLFMENLKLNKDKRDHNGPKEQIATMEEVAIAKPLFSEPGIDINEIKLREIGEKSQHLISKTNREYSLHLKGKKILVVDDDSRNIFVLASALEEYGAEILEAENGEEALLVLKEHQIDLVLMDIMMPVMDGFGAIKLIRKDPFSKEIPIIAITAKSLKEDQEKCIMVGANGYISKPVDYDKLIPLVKAWIDRP